MRDRARPLYSALYGPTILDSDHLIRLSRGERDKSRDGYSEQPNKSDRTHGITPQYAGTWPKTRPESSLLV